MIFYMVSNEQINEKQHKLETTYSHLEISPNSLNLLLPSTAGEKVALSSSNIFAVKHFALP